MGHVLVIDDDKNVLELIKVLLERINCSVTTTENAKDVKKLVSDNKYDLVVTDLLIPDMDGLEVIKLVKSVHKDMKIIAITGGYSAYTPVMLNVAKSLGAETVFRKPLPVNDFLSTVKSLMDELPIKN